MKNDDITVEKVQLFGAAQDPFVRHIITNLTKGSYAALERCTSTVMSSFFKERKEKLWTLFEDLWCAGKKYYIH